MQKLGKKIEDARKSKGYSRARLAKRLKVSERNIRSIEEGIAIKNFESVLPKITTDLQIPLSTLFGVKTNDANAVKTIQQIQTLLQKLIGQLN